MQSENSNAVPKPPKPTASSFLDKRMTSARAYSFRQRNKPKPQDITEKHKAEALRPSSFGERIRAAKDLEELTKVVAEIATTEGIGNKTRRRLNKTIDIARVNIAQETIEKMNAAEADPATAQA